MASESIRKLTDPLGVRHAHARARAGADAAPPPARRANALGESRNSRLRAFLLPPFPPGAAPRGRKG